MSNFQIRPIEGGDVWEARMASGDAIAGYTPLSTKLLLFPRSDTNEWYQKENPGGTVKRVSGYPPGYIHGGTPEYVSGTSYKAASCPCQDESRMRDEDDSFDITWTGEIEMLTTNVGVSGVASGVSIVSG